MRQITSTRYGGNLEKTLVLCAILFAILWHFEILRVHPDTECRGIDIQKHGEPAYPQVSVTCKPYLTQPKKPHATRTEP